MADLDRLMVLAHKADKGGDHIYTHWRDVENWAANYDWHVAATPEAFLGLIESLEVQREEVQRQLENRRLEWNRAEGLQAQVRQLVAEVARLKGEGKA